jgi:cytidine deaminase
MRKPSQTRSGRRAPRRRPSRSTLTAMAALAREARRRARAPFSRFKVGAALKTRTGEIVTGCNIENASYGLTLCAERVAVFKAVSEGLSDFDAIAVAAASRRLTPPCGACRQILWEFCGDILVHLVDLKGRSRTLRLSKLLPLPFDESNL